ncbi:MAG: PTS sugar transporter subunit IIA [Spirochaetota bacterium]
MSKEIITLFRPRVAVSTRDQVIETIAELAGPVMPQHTVDAIKDQLLKREKLTPTAIGHGVALPHCFFDGIDSFVTGLVTTESPVSYDAPDGTPVDLFFFIIAPSDQRSEHVALLSRISRFVRSESSRQQLRDATDDTSLRQISEVVFQPQDTDEEIQWSEVQLYVPLRVEIVTILEELTSRTTGNVFVHEFKKASSLLTRIPLFASLWTSDVDESIRLVVALLDKRLVNEAIRSMKSLLAEQNASEEVLITARDVFYVSGHVEL